MEEWVGYLWYLLYKTDYSYDRVYQLPPCAYSDCLINSIQVGASIMRIKVV